MTPSPHAVVTRELVSALPMLRAWLRHLGANAEQIDEAIQETAVWCCDHAEEFTPGTSFGAWTRSVARFRLLSIWRERSRAAPSLDPQFAEAIPDVEWDRLQQGGSAKAAALRHCLLDIDDQSRELVDRVYQRNESAATVAKSLHKTVAAVYMMLTRLRHALRTCVERRIGADVRADV